jgi:hypothetical protein
MDRVINLADIVQREVADYHGPALKATTYYFADIAEQKYVVIIVSEYERPYRTKAGVMVMARILGDYVVIDEDTTDRPLWKELVRAGIPRDKIICAYAGESLPESNISR